MRTGQYVRWLGVVCGCWCATAGAQTLIEGFEYPGDEDLGWAGWETSANAAISLSTDLAPGAPGEKCLKIEFQFQSVEWATETVKGPWLPEVIAMDPAQYLSLRIKGDPAFAAADFRDFYLYAYDDSGNFGRWGTAIPVTSDWKVLNFSVSGIALPWDSPGAPDFSRIARFAFFQYGSQAAIEPYAATIYLDELSLRDTPLTEGGDAKEAVVEAFEYQSDDELLAVWQPSANTVLTTSDSVSTHSTGTKSMKATFSFLSMEWATETVRGPDLAEPIAIGAGQYLTLRLKGDPAFAVADFRNFYLYAYDESGNFGRWGMPAPVTDEWQVVNFQASAMEKPWDSPALPDLNRILRFSIFQYGSQAAIEPYTASLQIDDLEVRNSPITEFPPASAPRSLIDDFEGYAADADLTGFYGYLNSPAATATTATLESPAPQGNRALRLAIDFAPGQYPWGSVRSAEVAPFSLPTNAVVSLRIKGDPALAGFADGGTSFWLSFYDESGSAIHYVTDAAPVVSSEWTQLEAGFADFSGTATTDVGNLVRWRILVQAWEGTPESEAISASVVVDDIRVSFSAETRPVLTLERQANELVLGLSGLSTGKVYEVRSSTDLDVWTSAGELSATGPTATWSVATAQTAAFFQVVEK